MTETLLRSDWEQFITCARCGAVDEERCEYPRRRYDNEHMQHDGDQADWECYECGLKQEVVLAVTYEFQTEATVASDQTSQGEGE